ncbi:MAG: SPOR domain-containing protein [Candidatus Omnitrophica bacterium]|nr:SPOR domain-containing protein [Candidatus Omnitrophota bacterium]
MWQAFRKKNSSGQPLKTLNEKEIQEKLYGNYHKHNQAAQVLEEVSERKFSRPTFNSRKLEEIEPSVGFPKVAEASQKKSQVLVTKPQALSENSNQKFEKTKESHQTAVWGLIGRRISWRIVSSVVAIIALAVFASQSFWQWSRSDQHQLRPPLIAVDQAAKSDLQVTVMPVTSQKQIAHTSETSRASSALGGIKTTRREGRSEEVQVISGGQKLSGNGPPKQIEQEKVGMAERIFAIQVCTYRQERDAQNLIERLQALKLPAYYEGFPKRDPSGSEPRFYIVLIGKYETYNEAQNSLTQFKTLPAAKEFLDAYIRRL